MEFSKARYIEFGVGIYQKIVSLDDFGSHERILLGLLFAALLLPLQGVMVAQAATGESYRSKTKILSDYQTLMSLHPEMMVSEVFGKTVLGANMVLFRVGNLRSPNLVMVDAAVHGNEKCTAETLYFFIVWVLDSSDPAASKMRATCCLLVIPIVEWDMYPSSRYNAHGVDINRNFETGWGKFHDPCRGKAPLSEPETRAIHNLFLNNRIRWYINLHSGDLRVTPPWGYLKYVPEKAYFYAVYSRIKSVSASRGVTPIPYVYKPDYGGGLLRDEGYVHGAYTFAVELSYSNPSISSVKSSLVPKLTSIMIAATREFT